MFAKVLIVLAMLLAVASANYAKAHKASSETILNVIFKLFKVDADAATCISDTTGVSQTIRDFGEEYDNKQYEQAVASLAKAFSAMSSSITDCGVPQVVHKFDAAALATKFAKISAKIDKVDSIIVGASDLIHDIDDIAAAAKEGDAEEIGSSINSFLNDWSQVTGGCGDHKGCKLVGGLLRIIQEVATDITPCKEALEPIVTQMEGAVISFKSKDYMTAVKDLADGLEAMSLALKDTACGVPKIADLIGKLSPKLAAAVVKVEDSKAVKIMVESADVYDDVFQLITAIDTGDWDTVGEELGNLLRVLRASSCETKACVILEGLMASVQEELSDFDSCMKDADRAWGDIEAGMADFKSKDYKDGVKKLGASMVQFANAVKDCDVSGIGSIAENMFNKLDDSTIANEIGDMVQLLVNGADVTLDINIAMLDFNSKNMAAFGSDLGDLASKLASTKCESTVCKIVEGLLNAAGVAFQDLKACEADLKKAEAGFSQGAQLFEDHHYGTAVKTWAGALSTVSSAVKDCGLDKELGFIQQEANVLGYANVSTSIGRDINILVHGADFYQELYSTLGDIKHHDYKAAGADLHGVVTTLSDWTGKHACRSDFCYVVVGVFQFLGDMKGSVKECEHDFQEAWTDFKYSYHNFSSSHENIIFHYKHDKHAIKAGMAALGEGMKDISKGVTDCHIEEFAELLEKLATKLGIAPEISLIEELLHILINGVKIEREIGDAMSDYGHDNWPGFGFNLAKLAKTLL